MTAVAPIINSATTSSDSNPSCDAAIAARVSSSSGAGTSPRYRSFPLPTDSQTSGRGEYAPAMPGTPEVDRGSSVAANADATDGLDIEALSAARDLLDATGYTPSGLASRIGIGPGLRLEADGVARARSVLRADRPLDLLARVFLLCDEVDGAAAVTSLGPDGVETLVRAGLAEPAEGRLRPVLQLVPHDDLVIASDVPGGEPSSDFVPGVQAPSDVLARLTPRRRVGRALDVGTGCGIQALLLARHADEVVATDVSPRALRIARTNAALNRTTGIEFRLGGLLDPVEGERFDLVVANPPYHISPEHKYVFRDAAGRGDDLVRNLARAMPANLADGALAIVLVSWVVEDGPPEPLGWATDPDCGRLLLVSRIQSAVDAAHTWNREYIADQQAYNQRIGRWLEFYERERVGAIGFGALVMSRQARRGAGWTASAAAPLDGPGPAGPHVLRLLANHAALAEAGGDVAAVGPLVLAADAELVERHRQGAAGLETIAVEIRLRGGIGAAASLDPGGAALVRAFDRPRTVDEAFRVLGVDRPEVRAPATAVVGSLLVNGLLELAD